MFYWHVSLFWRNVCFIYSLQFMLHIMHIVCMESYFNLTT
jgi:hypothetical protein